MIGRVLKGPRLAGRLPSLSHYIGMMSCGSRPADTPGRGTSGAAFVQSLCDAFPDGAL
jgi:hypothetical protein